MLNNYSNLRLARETDSIIQFLKASSSFLFTWKFIILLIFCTFLPAGLNSLQSGLHKQLMKDLFVELCLTVPVRLSSLLPYLPMLMDPLVSALNGSHTLISQVLPLSKTVIFKILHFRPRSCLADRFKMYVYKVELREVCCIVFGSQARYAVVASGHTLSPHCRSQKYCF